MRRASAATDFYEVLEVSPDAGPEEIKAAFRRLSKKYHPDANPARATGERFKQVSEAYATLSDPDRRREYDRMRRSASAVSEPGPREGSAGGGEPFAQWMTDMGSRFGGGRSSARPRRAARSASAGRQLLARLIDLVIVGNMVLLAIALGAEADALPERFFWVVLAGFAYETALVGWRGETIGMMAARVAVRTEAGGRPGWRKSAARMTPALLGLLVIFPSGRMAAWGVVVIVIAWAVRFFQRRRGRRPGRLSGAALGLGACIIILALLTSVWVLLPAVAGAYIASPLLSPTDRGLPDRLAGTVIVAR